ncbi:hypothetical protein ACFU2J_25410 [Streptomyces sp. NPDC057387]|uniref:hypothetical protein n=1 Tax=Streptomyces sp. NPDC057387 TaxID=3346115 RepID=UPI0036447260
MFGEPFGVQTALGLAAGLAAVVVVRRGNGADRTRRPARLARPGRSGTDRLAVARPAAGRR